VGVGEGEGMPPEGGAVGVGVGVGCVVGVCECPLHAQRIAAAATIENKTRAEQRILATSFPVSASLIPQECLHMGENVKRVAGALGRTQPLKGLLTESPVNCSTVFPVSGSTV